MIINHNISSLNSSRVLGNRETEISSSMSKLASGMRITRSGDDASGLAVSEKMRGQVRGLNQAIRNASSGISFIQSTEGYLQQTQEILGRIRELAIQAGNGIYGSDDRKMIDVEVNQLVAEVDRIASHAQFNGMNMLTGRFAKGAEGKGTAISFQIGANQNQSVSASVGTMTSKALEIREVSISTTEAANKAIGLLDKALTKVSQQRADLGAYQNRMESMVKGLGVAAENLTSAESLIRDANIAGEMVELTKNQILQQANVAMLIQANQKNQGALRLLGS